MFIFVRNAAKERFLRWFLDNKNGWIRSSRGLSSQQNVYFLLDPILVVGRVCVGASLVDQAAQIGELIDEIKELTDVIGDWGDVWILSLEMLFVHFAHSFHAFVDGFIVGISAGFGFVPRLHQQNCVAHFGLVIDSCYQRGTWDFAAFFTAIFPKKSWKRLRHTK